MRQPTPFDPIEPGETDNFFFDFASQMGAATIVSTSWTCSLAPYQTATDPDPQSRILSTSAQTLILVRDAVSGALVTKAGFFSVALIGGMPASAIGATYVLEATVITSDGRMLKDNSTVLCSQTAT